MVVPPHGGADSGVVFNAGWNWLARQVGCACSSTGALLRQKPNRAIWLPEDFMDQVGGGNAEATELHNMLVERYPEGIFAAGNAQEWDGGLSFFSLTREPTRRRKGLVEVIPWLPTNGNTRLQLGN
ncbi:MAG: hypothetical protein HY318_19100 [Armatimonadetes bacterium]|nr:hypothetical protein [Armatimonadota bacterium]